MTEPYLAEDRDPRFVDEPEPVDPPCRWCGAGADEPCADGCPGPECTCGGIAGGLHTPRHERYCAEYVSPLETREAL